MNGDAVDKIKELAQMSVKDSVIEIGGEQYSARSLNQIKEYSPLVEPVQLSTLSGFSDFISNNAEVFEPARYFAKVASPKQVTLCSELIGKARDREFPVDATVDKDLIEFPFGKWIDGETFIIRMRSLFQPTPDLEKLIAYTGKVSIEDGIKIEDDGITQQATVKRGISGALKGEEAAPVIVKLKPYRTFREIDQPGSEFLFRMQKGNSGIECALFEADGGAWRIAAVQAIKTWLAINLPGELAIIA